jgi:hypothetical protein
VCVPCVARPKLTPRVARCARSWPTPPATAPLARRR